MSRDHKTKKKSNEVKGPVLEKKLNPRSEQQAKIQTEEETMKLIEEQREMIFDHLEITCSGLVSHGMLETIIAGVLVELGINQMFRDWVEGDLDEEGPNKTPLTIEGMVVMCKAKLSELIDEMAEEAVLERKQLSIMIEDEGDAEPIKH